MIKTQARSGKVALFRQEVPGGLTYRIPALLYLGPESTFLAFAEKRSSDKDEDAEYLVMRRGHKEGASVQVTGVFAVLAPLPMLFLLPVSETGGAVRDYNFFFFVTKIAPSVLPTTFEVGFHDTKCLATKYST